MCDVTYFREVQSPITAAQLRPLTKDCEWVQFSEPLTETDHRKLAEFMRAYPRVALRVYDHHLKKCNLNLLRHYPHLRRLAVDIYHLKSLDALQHVSNKLEMLDLGQTKSRSHSLLFLQRFPNLRSLSLEAHTKDIEVIGTLSRLEDLTLRSITLPDLSILMPLERLLSLDIKLGGTKNLELLPKIGRLRYLELWMVRGLTDLSPIQFVPTLQYLFLQALKNVTKLPSLAGLPKLRRVHLETMKGLTNLRPVAQAPNLEELLVRDMGHLEPRNFRPFVGHPKLRRAGVYLGSSAKNEAMEKLLGLPAVTSQFAFKR